MLDPKERAGARAQHAETLADSGRPGTGRNLFAGSAVVRDVPPLADSPAIPDPLDTVLFSSTVVEIGAFRVRAGHPRFHDSGPIQRDIVVFPRTLVRIAHEGADGFVAGPDRVTFYNRGQAYRRDSVNGLPDRCEWFAFARPVLNDALGEGDDPERAPFRLAHGPSDPVSYLRQRQIVESLALDGADALAVEENSLAILARVLSAAGSEGGGCCPGAARRADRGLAEEAKTLIARTYRQEMKLARLAAALEVSVFRLCRVFRRETSTTLHAFRNGLRLAAALELLSEKSLDLTRIALELGYSSHSHFSEAFRRRFGVTPSTFRGAAFSVSSESTRRPSTRPEASRSRG